MDAAGLGALELPLAMFTHKIASLMIFARTSTVPVAVLGKQISGCSLLSLFKEINNESC